MLMELASIKESSKEFHIVEPLIPNERSSNLIVLDRGGTTRRWWLAEYKLDRHWFDETLT